RRAGTPPPRDHRPLRRGPAAVRERGRPAPADPQRRGLQLPRTAGGTRSEGPPLRLRDRHRGHPRGLSRVGRGLRPPLRRHVGVRDLGLARAPPPLLTRPFWGQAVLLPPRRRPPRLRER